MQSLDLFLSRLMPLVPGCPDPLARQALVDAATEFCEETSIVQYTSDPQDVVSGTILYDLDIPSQQSVVTTLKVWHGTTSLNPIPAAEIDSIFAYANGADTSTAQHGVPSLFYEHSAGVIGVYPIPNANLTAGLSTRIVTRPTRTATSFEDILYTDWVEGIVAGAAYRLCSIPGQVFTNAATAQQCDTKFWADIGKATAVGLRGRIRSSMNVKARRFA